MQIENYKFFRSLSALPYVEKILLYGSRARGDNQERADIDLAIVCPNATRKNWLELMEIIEEADTLLKIDCVRFDELSEKSSLRSSIATQGIKLYERS